MAIQHGPDVASLAKTIQRLLEKSGRSRRGWKKTRVTTISKGGGHWRREMSKLGGTAVAAILSLAVTASPAMARGGWHGGGHDGGGGGFHHGFHDHDGFRGGFFFGGVGGFYDPYLGYPYYGYPYAYPYAYPYPYPYPYATPYAPAAAPAAPPPEVWYFCPPTKAYYPYVSSCSVPWQPVPARPR